MPPPASPPLSFCVRRPRVLGLATAALVIVLLATMLAASPAAAAPGDDPRPVLYLTFDDGPGEDTPAFLDLLDRYDATATFFVTGAAVSADPDTAVRIVADGHAVANHTWSHPRLSALPDGSIRDQFTRTTAVIEATTGVRPVCYRPPYGATNARVHAVAVDVGLPNAQWITGATASHWGLWDVDTNDWRLSRPSSGWTETAMRSRLDRAADGDTVLLHDGFANRRRGLRVLEAWLADNHERFEFRALPGCGGRPAVPVEPAMDPANPEQWHRARIARLYQAYFGRLPDADGFEYWNHQVATGAPMEEISQSFAIGSEFTRTAVLSDEEFVRHLYGQVLAREAEPAGLAYWLDQLAGGTDRGSLMLYFSDGREFVRRSAPSITGDCFAGDVVAAWACWGAAQPVNDWSAAG